MNISAPIHSALQMSLPSQVGGHNSRLDQAQSDLPGQASQEVAEKFESVFLSLMLKEMRSTISENGLFSGDKSDTLGGLFDMFMGQQLAQSRSLGVAAMVQTYVDRIAGTTPGSDGTASPAVAPTAD